MEFHENKLALLCRLCGEKFILSRGYAEARAASELKEIIQHAYNIDIEEDVPNIHPPSVCNKCYMKLYRLQKKPITDIVSKIPFFFSKHDDFSCVLCESSKVGRKKQNVNVKHDIIKIGEKYGFKCHIIDMDKLFSYEELYGNRLSISKSILVQENGEWIIRLFERDIQRTANIYSNFPELFNLSSAETILSQLASLNVCIAK